jgi:hypothetical protein
MAGGVTGALEKVASYHEDCVAFEGCILCSLWFRLAGRRGWLHFRFKQTAVADGKQWSG